MKFTLIRIFLFLAFCNFNHSLQSQDNSIAREWNEILLEAIRNDFARPTVHARNLWHCSMAMYDLWAVYDEKAKPYFLGNTVGDYTCPFDNFTFAGDVDLARKEAISFAMYRILSNRFINSPGAGLTIVAITEIMQDHGYNINNTSIDYQSGDPAALGNYIAQNIVDFGLQDNSQQQNDYANLFYNPVNDPLIVEFPGAGMMNDPNRWQPLTLQLFIDQSGNVIPFNTPDFLSPEWGEVVPFALANEDLTIFQRDGDEYYVYHDPGSPPLISLTEDNEESDLFKREFAMVSVWGSHLDPSDGVMVDISPGTLGNIDDLPASYDEHASFYNYIEGGDASNGHELNPVTGLPYESNIVSRADYARVLAEFWADGPDSETPPGHWFTILNYVNDHPLSKRKYRGFGDDIEELEWDIKSYFMLAGAMHDCAITAWGIKGWYDYLRPISAIRSMADRGQSSDTNLANYDIGGIPLIPGYIEMVDENDTLVGENQEHLNKIKLYTWKGPEYIEDPDNDVAGVGWILAENWWPYQRPSFVSPPFAGFISGHSTYSRAAADVLAYLTGDQFFPGGMGEFIAEKNDFLVFEDGPSNDVILQWATYRDASDQTSLSRIWGGIHPSLDDIPGRRIGIVIAEDVISLAENYFFTDEDGDGYYNYLDCNDMDSSIHPDAIEICDGIDNNCSGIIDENLPLFSYYVDTDNDGFGNLVMKMDTCITFPPLGFVANSLDCNDNDSNINPDSPEICDGIDNNCSGAIDENLPLFSYYLDNDNDGFGNLLIKMDTCITFPPLGFVANSLDCNDDDLEINPNTSEICDGIDNDCSGIIDDGLTIYTYYYDADGDGFGDLSSPLDTCLSSPINQYVTNALDCEDSDLLINPDINEVCDDIDNDCNGIINDGLDRFRYYLDNDGDGFGEEFSFVDTCIFVAPFGFVIDSTDCDDDNGLIYPGALDLADNGIDEDCSGYDLYQQIKIIPNPFSDELRIQFDFNSLISVDIFSSIGQLVFTSDHLVENNFVRLNLNHLETGIYALRISDSDEQEIFSRMIVKN